MMTREEVCEILEHPLHNTSEFALKRNKRVLDHDQGQRAVIVRLEAEHRDLVLRNKLLREALESYATCTDGCTCGDGWSHDTAQHALNNVKAPAELGKETQVLREALQLLYDCQNGCPLPKYETDWNRAMELAQHALKEEVTGA